MDVILDTCILLSLSGLSEKKLSQKVSNAISTCDELYISSCSLFEIAIKYKKKNLDLGKFSTASGFWEEAVNYYNLLVLPVEDRDFVNSVLLPDHHIDPFDRIIIAQALRLNIPVISYDSQFGRYDVTLIS